MPRTWAMVVVSLGFACGQNGQPTGGRLPRSDGGATKQDAGRDAGTSSSDASVVARDAGRPDAGGVDAGAPLSDAGPGPVDCPVAAPWMLCRQSASSCEVKFTDGAGCAAVCSSLGLDCAEVFEDVEGACEADLARPALGCAMKSGHQSDYCVCVVANCTPDCSGRVCGSDGCGGTCGSCAGVERCDDGQCVSGEDCTQYPFSASVLLGERAGFGDAATGGDPSRVYRVTTLAGAGNGSLRNALESAEPYWIVFDVNGKITHNNRVDVRSNKTIDGRGRTITVEGTLLLDDVRNVIISDIAVTNTLEGRCGQDGDVIRISGTGGATPASYSSRDIWLHHVEAFDGGDGLIDVRGGSNITMSWTHLHTHKKGMLLAWTRDNAVAPGMRVTFHHNFFDRVSLRGPQFKFGHAHYYNNYQKHWYEYGAGSLSGAQLYSENNVYEARPGTVCVPACPDPSPCGDDDRLVSKNALVTDWADDGRGAARSVGDLALNDAVIEEYEPNTVFLPSSVYSYVAEPADAALSQRVEATAGPRVDYCRP